MLAGLCDLLPHSRPSPHRQSSPCTRVPPRPRPAAPPAEPTAERPVLQNGFFNNKLYFFQAFLSYLYLLSFVLHEDFLWDAGTIEPVRIFLQVIGIPAWSLPEV